MVFGFAGVGHARDPLRQPFHHDSIWNRPIGSGAVYVHANIQKATEAGMTVDEDLIVMTPEAPLLDIYRNDAGWNRNRSRCTIDGPVLFRAPIPTNFIVSPQTWDGLTPNSGLAVLMPDRRTIKQTQPFARCEPGYGTSRYMFGDEDIYGMGYYGAHGGSGLSCIGGTLRVGELVPGAGPIRHALKVNVFAARNLYYDEETRGYRWPARRADGYAPRTYGSKGKPVKDCRMGALLALPPTINIEKMGLETEPARILARAFQDYGAYVVDDTAWDVYALVTEWGPAGRVTEEFKRVWGFDINPRRRDNPWSRDMDRIFTNLHVVANNRPDRIGGGGAPRVPLAEPLTPPVSTKTSWPAFTLTNGAVRLAGVGPDNPILYDNDWWFDVFDNNYLWAQASLGNANLRGNIVSRDMWDWEKGYHYSFEQCWKDAEKALKLARESGLKNIPDLTRGADRVLARPASGRIEDTIPHPTDGSRLIVAEAAKASPEKPLLIIAGGPLTTVANALLTNPEIGSKMVVFNLTVSSYGYNGKDAWSAYIVARRTRYVDWGGGQFWDKDLVFRAEHFQGLPDNPFTRDMKRLIQSDLGRANQLGDGAALVWLFEPKCWTGAEIRRADFDGRALVFHPVPPGETGHVLVIPKSATDLKACREEFFRVMLDPKLFANKPVP